jgi:hypothetical protein
LRALAAAEDKEAGQVQLLHGRTTPISGARQRQFSGINSGIAKVGGGLRAGAEMPLAAGDVGGAVYMGAQAPISY